MRAVARSTSPANPRDEAPVDRHVERRRRLRRSTRPAGGAPHRSAPGASRMRGETRSASSSSCVAINSPGIREPHQATRRDDDGQGAEWRVVGAMGDVEEARRPPPGERALARSRCEVECRAGARPSARRRSRSSVTASPPVAAAAGPALTFCRAASSLVPSAPRSRRRRGRARTDARSRRAAWQAVLARYARSRRRQARRAGGAAASMPSRSRVWRRAPRRTASVALRRAIVYSQARRLSPWLSRG